MKLLIRCLICFWLSSSLAKEISLLEVYQDALAFDPVYKANIEKSKADWYDFSKALASMLPNLQAKAEYSDTNRIGSSSTNNTGGVNANFFSASGQAYSYDITLTQSIFSIDKMANLQAGHYQRAIAKANAIKAEQDLMLRVAQAYFSILEARDNLRFTQAEKKAKEKSLKQAKERYEVGVDPITSVHNAQAGYDAILAKEIAARNRVDNQLESLMAITGIRYTLLKKLNHKIPLTTPQPQKIEHWVNAALSQNLSVVVAKQLKNIKQNDIQKARGGHLPTINAFARFQESKSRTPIATNQLQNLIVGLNMNLPIMEGGGTIYRSKQAAHLYEESVADLESTKRMAATKTRQTFNSILAGISQIRANRQAVVSAMSSLKSTREAFSAGTRTIVDVLDAEQDLFQARQSLSSSTYQYINDTLTLKQIAGILNPNDLHAINQLLS